MEIELVETGFVEAEAALDRLPAYLEKRVAPLGLYAAAKIVRDRARQLVRVSSAEAFALRQRRNRPSPISRLRSRLTSAKRRRACGPAARLRCIPSSWSTGRSRRRRGRSCIRRFSTRKRSRLPRASPRCARRSGRCPSSRRSAVVAPSFHDGAASLQECGP